MHTKGDRRDAGLKMGWTKPLPGAWPMGIDRRLDLWQGSDMSHPLLELSRTKHETSSYLIFEDYDKHPTLCRHG
jgi:hypothetical protein